MRHIHQTCIAFALISLQILGACKKSFLDVPITQEVVAEQYLTNLTASEEFLNGLYHKVERSIGDGNNVIYADLIADNLKVVGNTNVARYQWNQDLAANNCNGFWRDAYGLIRSCNYLLERIDQFRGENPVKCDAIKGQLFAIRAMAHDNLVKVFAQPMNYTADGSHVGIPYDTLFDRTQHFTRQSVADVYQHIVRDLQQAIQLIPLSLKGVMPTNITPQIWISQQAARALLARTYLFMGDLPKAKDAAITVIGQTTLMPTADYPAKLYTPNDKESLFWSPPITTNFAGSQYALDLCVATQDLVDLIKARPLDKRNAWFKAFPSGNWQVLKFPQGAVPGRSSAASAYYQSHIRTSEMYLTAAECYAKSGSEDSARYYLDKIRQRADPSAAATTATGVPLLDSIYLERRIELCFENMRMYDLLRLGKGVKRKDVVSPAPRELPFPSVKAVAPLPDLDATELSLEQNPSYE